MSIVAEIIFIALVTLSIVGVCYWCMALLRIGATLRATPSARDGLEESEPGNGWPLVSIIVPAHNEQRVIDACAKSLREQNYPHLEIIFVLDRCSDETANRIATHSKNDERIRVLTNDTCPPDWAGKCNAARLGAEAANGQWLLFTDADTRFDPALVRAAVARALRDKFDLLSMLSTLTAKQWFERAVQPIAAMNLLRMYPITRVNTQRRPFANGQFMLFNRETYDVMGGHTAVKDDLLEDIALARAIDRHGGRGGLILPDGMLRCSMYDSFDAFRSGWKRIYIEACKRKPRRLRNHAWRVLAVGVGMPVAQIITILFSIGFFLNADLFRHELFAGLGIAVVLGGFVAQAFALGWIFPLTGSPRRSGVFYPVASFVIARVMFGGAKDLLNRRPVMWGGKEYILKPR